jgi:transposase-like protein
MKKHLIRMLVFLTAAFAAQAEELDITREALSKWVETRKLISEEKQKWELEREVLGDRIDLVRAERDSLSKKIHETQSLITDADKKREDLVKENDALKNASATLINRIFTLEQDVLAVLPTLPEPVQDRIKPLSQRIPKTEETDLALSERYQNVIGIVNELNKGAGEITVVSEIKKLGDGTTAEVQTLYVGYACAYACNNNADKAFIGRPTAEGWVWEQNDAIAQQVADSISILKNEKVAEFIPLPVNVDQGRLQ